MEKQYNLEERICRLEDTDKTLRDEFRISIQTRNGILDDAHMPNDMTAKIMGYFRARDILIDGKKTYSSFGNDIKHGVNPKSLRDIMYGMWITDEGKLAPIEVPMRLISPLSEIKDWGKYSLIYMFAGMGLHKTSENKISYSENTVYGNLRELIINGMSSIRQKNSSYGINHPLIYEDTIASNFAPPKIAMKKPITDIKPEQDTKDYNNLSNNPFPEQALNQTNAYGGTYW